MDSIASSNTLVHERTQHAGDDGGLLSRIRKQLVAISEEQESLNESREALLLERSAFQSHGKKVRAQRIRTRDAQVAFMNLLRAFLNEQRATLPAALTSSYDIVQVEDDALGAMESDFQQSEEALGSQEWEFSEQEGDFYQYKLQELFSPEALDNLDFAAPKEAAVSHAQPNIVPSKVLEFQEAIKQQNQLVRRFDNLRSVQTEVLETIGDDAFKPFEPENGTLADLRFWNNYSALLAQIMDHGIKTQQLKRDLMQEAIPATAILVPGSENQRFDDASIRFQSKPQSLLDGTPPDPLYGFPIRERVEEWLFSYMKGNALERRRFLNDLQAELDSHEEPSLRQEYWDDLVTRFWLSDATAEMTQVHSVLCETDQSSDTEMLSHRHKPTHSGKSTESHSAQAQYTDVCFMDVPLSSQKPNGNALFEDENLWESLDESPIHHAPEMMNKPLSMDETETLVLPEETPVSDQPSQADPADYQPLPLPKTDVETDISNNDVVALLHHTLYASVFNEPEAGPSRVVGCPRNGLLEVPVAPRYDSGQESDCEEHKLLSFRDTNRNSDPACKTSASEPNLGSPHTPNIDEVIHPKKNGAPANTSRMQCFDANGTQDSKYVLPTSEPLFPRDSNESAYVLGEEDQHPALNEQLPAVVLEQDIHPLEIFRFPERIAETAETLPLRTERPASVMPPPEVIGSDSRSPEEDAKPCGPLQAAAAASTHDQVLSPKWHCTLQDYTNLLDKTTIYPPLVPQEWQERKSRPRKSDPSQLQLPSPFIHRRTRSATNSHCPCRECDASTEPGDSDSDELEWPSHPIHKRSKSANALPVAKFGICKRKLYVRISGPPSCC